MHYLQWTFFKVYASFIPNTPVLDETLMLQTANVASSRDEEGAAVYIHIKSVSIILFITVKVYVV